MRKLALSIAILVLTRFYLLGLAPEASSAMGTQWSLELLAGLGNAVPTQDTVNFVDAWQRSEGTDAVYNPLATTQPMNGDSCFNYLHGHCGVRNYPSRATGLHATILTLTNGSYPHILYGLQTNNPEEALNDEELGTWGTGWGALKRNWVRDTYGVPDHRGFASNPIESDGSSAVSTNVRAALNARGGALRHTIIRPGQWWSFNAAVGDPSVLAAQLTTIVHPGDGWCNLAARYAQSGRAVGLIPQFQDHLVGDLGGGVENSVAIWNTDGMAGTTDGRQDLELYNPTNHDITLDAIERDGQVIIVANIL